MNKELVISYDGFDPVSVATQLNINPRKAWLSTASTPGNNTFQFPLAHHRATRIPLRRKLENEKDKTVFV